MWPACLPRHCLLLPISTQHTFHSSGATKLRLRFSPLQTVLLQRKECWRPVGPCIMLFLSPAAVYLPWRWTRRAFLWAAPARGCVGGGDVLCEHTEEEAALIKAAGLRVQRLRRPGFLLLSSCTWSPEFFADDYHSNVFSMMKSILKLMKHPIT